MISIQKNKWIQESEQILKNKGSGIRIKKDQIREKYLIKK